MYQQSTAGAGCLGCGLGRFAVADTEREGIRVMDPDVLHAASSVSHPGALAVMQAVERGDIVLPNPERTMDTYALDEPGAPGMPMWVYGVAGLGVLSLVGGAIWWFIKRGEDEEAEE